MAVQLIKLHVTASSETITKPNIERFFYKAESDTAAGNTLTIDANKFLNDTGGAVNELPVLENDNSYYNVYINGVLQMGGLSTYTDGAAGSLVITLPAESGDILKDTPIVLEVVNYAPETDTTITT